MIHDALYLGERINDMTGIIWHKFYCRNIECDWSCPGTFNLRAEVRGCLPDTDCPKCGSHDSVTASEEDIAQPIDLDDVRKRVSAVDLPYGAWWHSDNCEETVAYKAMKQRIKGNT